MACAFNKIPIMIKQEIEFYVWKLKTINQNKTLKITSLLNYLEKKIVPCKITISVEITFLKLFKLTQNVFNYFINSILSSFFFLSRQSK